MPISFKIKTKRISIDRYIQLDDYSCGPVSLYTVLHHHGSNVGMREVRKACNLTTNGSWEKDLVKAARKLGFVCRYRKSSISNIIEELDAGRPIICSRLDLPGYEEDGHWSVICDYTDKNLIMADPSVIAKSRISRKKSRWLLEDPLLCIRPR